MDSIKYCFLRLWSIQEIYMVKSNIFFNKGMTNMLPIFVYLVLEQICMGAVTLLPGLTMYLNVTKNTYGTIL